MPCGLCVAERARLVLRERLAGARGLTGLRGLYCTVEAGEEEEEGTGAGA